MKLLYKSLLFLMIFICSVGSVCATDTDNITVDNSLSYINSDEIVEDIELSNIDNLNNNVSDDNNYCCGVYIDASDFTLEYGTGREYSVYVHDYYGNPVNQGEVHFTYNGDENNANWLMYREVINGRADFVISSPGDGVGIHKGIISYHDYSDDSDDDRYLSCNKTVNVNVVKANAYITKEQGTAYYKSNDCFMFGVYTKDDWVRGVKLKVDVYTGSSYKTFIIDKGSGLALLDADKIGVGSHKVVVNVYDPNVNAKTLITTITCKKAPTKVYAPKVCNFYKANKYFKVTVKNSLTGKIVKGLKLKLTVYTGKKHKNYYVKTNGKGVAKLSTKYLKKGTHKVLIKSANSKYSVSKTSYIIIKKKHIKSTYIRIKKLIKSNDYPYSKSISGGDYIWASYDPHYSPQIDCARGTDIAICGDGREPNCHVLVKAKIYFKNNKGKVITKTYKSYYDNEILEITPKGYTPYKARVYYYHT